MERCKRCLNEINIERHHIHPRFMDNQEGRGEVINLCKGCHVKLHLIISSILWRNIGTTKNIILNKVITFSKSYIENYDKKNLVKQLELSDIDDFIKRCPVCDREVDIEDKYCEGCFTTLIQCYDEE